MTTLLVLTTGHRDVQIVVDGVRHEFDGKTCGELHDEIEKRDWSLVSPPACKNGLLSTLPEGELALCTPKLDAVLAFFDDSLPSAALVFETRRSQRSDPRLSGTVLERRLHERSVANVVRVAFLEGEERLEDTASAADSIVRQVVVTRLSAAIAERIATLKPERVVIATTGGFAAANAVIEELVRLHAVGGPADVTSLEVPDGALTQQHDRAIPERFHPASGFRARWQALSLVEKGNLLGAWGAANHLENEPGQEWTNVIKWLARFASSLPIREDCDLSVLSHPRMAVRAALRVEFALRAGDIPRAVHGTVAFLESALWDRLLEHFERDPQDTRWLRLRDGKTAPTGKLLRDGCDDDKNRPFESKQRSDGQPWFWFHESGAGRFARDYVQSQPLRALLDAVDKVRKLRNDVAHNEPTPELMDDARRRMREAQLWSTNDTFLSQPLVQAVLKDLGESAPELLLSNLLDEVRRRLAVPLGVSETP